MKSTKWHIIAWTPERGGESVGEYETEEEAVNTMNDWKAPDCVDPYYNHLVSLGGHLRVEEQ